MRLTVGSKSLASTFSVLISSSRNPVIRRKFCCPMLPDESIANMMSEPRMHSANNTKTTAETASRLPTFDSLFEVSSNSQSYQRTQFEISRVDFRKYFFPERVIDRCNSLHGSKSNSGVGTKSTLRGPKDRNSKPEWMNQGARDFGEGAYRSSPPSREFAEAL